MAGSILADANNMEMNDYIIIVDDDLDDQSLIADALEYVKFPAASYFLSTGEEMIEHLDNLSGVAPKVIVLDLNMPKITGFNILRYLKSKSELSQIPVIVFSTSSTDKDKVAALNLGASSFITKPSSYPELIGIVENFKKDLFS